MVDYYKTLEVQRGSSTSDIRKAYRRLALKWHPDKNPENQEEANRKFKEISEAYEVLSDEKKRRMYDQYGKDGLGSQHRPRSHSHAFDEDFDFGFNSYSFRDPQDVFREFFGNDPFADLFAQMTGFQRPQANHHHHQSQQLSNTFFDPFGFGFGDFMDTSGGFGGGFTSMTSFGGSMGGSAGGNVKRTSTSTRFVNGKKIVTKRVTENGHETVSTYENDVLTSRTVNGVLQN